MLWQIIEECREEWFVGDVAAPREGLGCFPQLDELRRRRRWVVGFLSPHDAVEKVSRRHAQGDAVASVVRVHHRSDVVAIDDGIDDVADGEGVVDDLIDGLFEGRHE